jgi:hypothetical protein
VVHIFNQNEIAVGTAMGYGLSDQVYYIWLSKCVSPLSRYQMIKVWICHNAVCGKYLLALPNLDVVTYAYHGQI